VRWEGQPGQRTVWLVRGEGLDRPAVIGVGLPAGADGPFRHYQPYTVPADASPIRVARIGLGVIDWSDGRDDLWRRYLGRSLRVREGLAVVVGENQNLGFADSVFVVIEAGTAPTTYDVAIGWRHRGRGRHNPFTDGAWGGSDPTAR
jgi:hypothetical protein